MMDVVDRMRACKDEHLEAKFEHAVGVVERAFELYSLKQVAFSFNGGKDSTALLHIMRAALTRVGVENGSCSTISSFMFMDRNDFPEIMSFSEEMDIRYNMGMSYLEGPIQNGLQAYLRERSIQAVVIGTRRGDPNAPGQEYYCPSDKGWPPFMRVNPVLDWTFQDIWAFLRLLNVPYCQLYDLGYTSIGGVHNTAPNNALRKEDGSFAPAYLLADIRLERSGRSMLTRKPSDTAAITRTAGIVAIGDELLAGKVEDINTIFLCKELRTLGWKVNKVVVIGDDVDVIADEVGRMSAACELVITSGGVGPTLDDVTMAGVARALDTSLARDPNLVERMTKYFNDNTTEAHLKMTEVPQRDMEILDVIEDDGSSSPFPVVKCNNIYILPGVPHLLRAKFQAVKKALLDLEPLPPFHNIVVRLTIIDETHIAPVLDDIAEAAGVDVEIGSYPISNQKDGAGILICLESKDPVYLEVAYANLKDKIDPGGDLW